MKIGVHSSKAKNGEPRVRFSGQEAERPALSGPYDAILGIQRAIGNHAFAKEAERARALEALEHAPEEEQATRRVMRR
jgi:hypothetical protein